MERNIEEWLRLDTNPSTHDYILALKERYVDGDESAAREVEDLFAEQISFGTAGLRSILGPGFSRMNCITVQLASQGIAEYLLEGRTADKVTVLIGHDHRHGSEEFAMTAAKTYASRGINVLLMRRIVPTPYVSFGVKLIGASFGVMITASHNPKDDNGYKVYGPSSSQICSPVDKEITALIQDHDRELWDLSKVETNFEDPFDRIHEAYLASTSCSTVLKSIPKIVYTPMHGVGDFFQSELIKRSGLPALIPVLEQRDPNPDFPTVAFPNPEEGAGALSLAFKTAEKHGATLIFANDPDADRFNFAELVNVEWKIFNGNQIALLLADHLWRHRPTQVPADRFAMVTSLVSSEMLHWMALKEGFHFEKVATGFKNLAACAQRLQTEGYTVLLAYEEAIGYMVGTNVWDKDGLSALLTAYQMIIDLHPMTLNQRLAELYDLYGHQVQYNSYFRCKDPKKTFQALLININSSTYSLTARVSSSLVHLELSSDTWIAFRASGTEPKLKFYSETKSDSADPGQYLKLRARVLSICDQLLEPLKHGLELQEA